MKQYKKSFATKQEAQLHEAEMKVKLTFPAYAEVVACRGKETVQEYLENWIEQHGKANLRPSTVSIYESHIRNHIVPVIGHVRLCKLTTAMLDFLFQDMFDKGLSNSSVRSAQRILNVALESARKHYYIDSNPIRGTLTKLDKVDETSCPDTSAQTQQLMEKEME